MLLVTDSRCLDHRPPHGMPESPRRLESLLESGTRNPGAAPSEGLVAVDLNPTSREPLPHGWQRLDDEAVERAIQRVHSADYVRRLRAAIQRGDGLIDSADNPLSTGTWVATHAATRAAVEAATFAVRERTSVLVAVRPPGHHAVADAAMGFCYLNHIAVAAQCLLDSIGLERVAIVDFDVHHGNGTQAIFYEAESVFFGSLHQFPFYPGTGAATERGAGAGEGTTLNLPLPAGAGAAEWLEAIDREMLPALEAFRPDALLLSAGFDAWRKDPLGGMRLDESAYHDIGHRFGEFASRQCQGRLAAMLEGGYDTVALPRLVASFAQGVSSATRRALDAG